MTTTALLHKIIDFGDPPLFLVTKVNTLRTDGTNSMNSGSGTELFPSLILLSNKVIQYKMCGRSQIKSRFIGTSQGMYCVLDPFPFLICEIGITYNKFLIHRYH